MGKILQGENEMKCPFCDDTMDHVYKNQDYFKCRGFGRLLTDQPRCPYKDQLLTKTEIEKIKVILIDLEME